MSNKYKPCTFLCVSLFLHHRFDTDQILTKYFCNHGQDTGLIHYIHKNKKFKSIDDTVSKFYILMDVVDKPGVLAMIAEVFGKNLVSIESMVQKQRDTEKSARLIFITHEVVNKNLSKSIEEMSKLDVVDKVLSVIRVEDLS